MVVQAPRVEPPAGALLVHHCVGHDVVVVWEGVQGPAGEVLERCGRPPLYRHPLPLGPRRCRLVLEEGQADVVAGLDGTEDLVPRLGAAEEGKDAE